MHVSCSFVLLIRDFQVISRPNCILHCDDVTNVGLTENYYLDKSICTHVSGGKCFVNKRSGKRGKWKQE